MKLGATLLILPAVLLTSSLAFASPADSPQAQVSPAPSSLELTSSTPEASSCGAEKPSAFLPELRASATPVLCNQCSSVFCRGKAVGAFCGPTTVGRCVVGPACSPVQVTCLCQ